jgi:hypothetical protein
VDNLELSDYLGDTVTGIRRIHHVLGDTVNRGVGAVEFRFASGKILFCDAGPDGDSIALTNAAWIDPFERRMTPENLEFIRRSGKRTAFDVSSHELFRGLIGGKVFDIAPMIGLSGKKFGLVINVYGVLIAVYANFDECYVSRLP